MSVVKPQPAVTAKADPRKPEADATEHGFPARTLPPHGELRRFQETPAFSLWCWQSMQDVPPGARALSLGGVSFTAEAVYEGTATRPRFTVPRTEIEHLRLRHGFVARHPFFLGLLELALVGSGIVPPLDAVIRFIREGVIAGHELVSIMWLVLAVPALYGAFRQGYTLDVQTACGLRTLEFHRGVSSPELETFLRQAEGIFGYDVEKP